MIFSYHAQRFQFLLECGDLFLKTRLLCSHLCNRFSIILLLSRQESIFFVQLSILGREFRVVFLELFILLICLIYFCFKVLGLIMKQMNSLSCLQKEFSLLSILIFKIIVNSKNATMVFPVVFSFTCDHSELSSSRGRKQQNRCGGNQFMKHS